MFRCGFCNYHHFWFRNSTMLPFLGIDFWFVQFPCFQIQFSYPSSEEISDEKNRSFTKLESHIWVFGSIELRSNNEQTVMSIPWHLKITPMEASDLDSFRGRPGRLGASTLNARGSRSGHTLRSGFGFASPMLVGVHDTLCREKSWL